MVEVVLERDEAPRTVAVPAWLKKIISTNARAKAHWAQLSFTHQKEYVREITGAKRQETRDQRLATMMAALRKGERKK